jgi:hypothetical protein
VKEERRALIEYRLEQADESLESARILWEHKKYRPSVSRSYYAMFYAVQALLTRKELITSKHSGAIAVFNREFVVKNWWTKNFRAGCRRHLIFDRGLIRGRCLKLQVNVPKPFLKMPIPLLRKSKKNSTRMKALENSRHIVFLPGWKKRLVK